MGFLNNVLLVLEKHILLQQKFLKSRIDNNFVDLKLLFCLKLLFGQFSSKAFVLSIDLERFLI